jgi:hypothetical protein
LIAAPTLIAFAAGDNAGRPMTARIATVIIVVIIIRYLRIVCPSSNHENKKGRVFTATTNKKAAGPFPVCPRLSSFRGSCHERSRQTSPKKPKKLKKTKNRAWRFDISI